jgi:tRNA(Arg) A34 adenosine deaminase TadA
MRIVAQGESMSDSTTHFMRAALYAAREGLEKGELPIGAVVVLDEEIISTAYTQEKAQGGCSFMPIS